MSYKYKVVPAPMRGLKAKGLKTAQDRFANALQTVMNDLAADGWEYLRADTLPSEQREGLISKTTVYQNMLVFRQSTKPKNKAPMSPEPRLTNARAKTGEERLAEKAVLTQSKPMITKSQKTDEAEKNKPDPSSDLAAE